MNIKNKWKAIERRPDIIGWIAITCMFLLLVAHKFGVLVGYLAFELAAK